VKYLGPKWGTDHQDVVGGKEIGGYGSGGLAGLFGVQVHLLSGGTCALQKNICICINNSKKARTLTYLEFLPMTHWRVPFAHQRRHHRGHGLEAMVKE
jgi:hypothetical protein